MKTPTCNFIDLKTSMTAITSTLMMPIRKFSKIRVFMDNLIISRSSLPERPFPVDIGNTSFNTPAQV
ncbi:MAG TPA: hypothetical protein VFW49_16050 [Fluviicoccus sp.]|nr:hypothetical protein [Fluviicoccus sp.]